MPLFRGDACLGGSFARECLELLHRRTIEQRSVLNQAAELLFSHVMMFPLSCLQVFDRFVFNFQSVQFNDANEFIARFPDLPLL